jgi:ankyrin repeat protein
MPGPTSATEEKRKVFEAMFAAVVLKDPKAFDSIFAREPTGAIAKEVVNCKWVLDTDTGLMHEAAGARYSEGVMKTLLDLGADPNLRDGVGYTPLHFAAGSNNVEAAKVLLLKGAHVNDQTPRDGVSPLHIAAAEGSLDIIILLLEKNAGVNLIDNKGRTPLHAAVFRLGGLQFINRLWEAKADAVINRLLEAKADVNARDRKGHTPLIYAIHRRDTTKMVRLLDAGANPNHRDEYDRSVLESAIIEGHFAMVGLLIERQADPHQKDKAGKSAFDFAWSSQSRLFNRVSMVKIMIRVARTSNQNVPESGNVSSFAFVLNHPIKRDYNVLRVQSLP